MRKKLLLSLGLLAVNLLFAQGKEEEHIRITLNNYIEGSSYNKLKQLESAFTTDATLYLKNKEQKSMKISPKEYVAFFKGKKGTFNGRVGTILAINIENDIATAKVEILISKTKSRYIDLFLLRKDQTQDWKIISKTATLMSTGLAD